jgi:hypothetical protein
VSGVGGSPAEYEARLQALAEAHGLPYRTPEEREANFKAMHEAFAAKRSEQNRAAAQSRHDATRNDCASHETETKAEYDRKRRSEAEAIRVANGGSPALSRCAAKQRTYSVPAVVAPSYDKERDDLLLLIYTKLPEDAEVGLGWGTPTHDIPTAKSVSH